MPLRLWKEEEEQQQQRQVQAPLIDPTAKYNTPAGGSDSSDDEKRTNTTAVMSEDENSYGNSNGLTHHSNNNSNHNNTNDNDYQALDNISMAETASEQNDDGDDLFETGSNPGDFLASRETRAMNWLRVTVTAALAVACVIVSATVYFTVSSAQQRQFQREFDEASEQLIHGFVSTWDVRFRAMGSLAEDLMSFANHIGEEEWPDMTFPDFAQRAHSTLGLAQGNSVALLPIVSDSNRDEWEHYSVDHVLDWLTPDDAQPGVAGAPRLRASVARRQEHDIPSIHGQIFDFDGPAPAGSGPFAPVWQTFPVTEHLTDWVNVDLLSIKDHLPGLEQSVNTKGLRVEQVVNLNVTSGGNQWSQLLQALLGKPDSTYANEPASPLYWPLEHKSTNDSVEVVGILMYMLYWRFCFADVLRPSTKGLVVVVHNQCEQSFTYRVDGSHPRFLGDGDLHERVFDKMAKQATLMANSDQECFYAISVYPSKAMLAKFVTYGPMLYTLLVFVIFGVACAVFYIYDFLVERRQKVVMEQAAQSTAIVSSLFPEAVRDRLFGDGGEGGGGDDHTHGRASMTGTMMNGVISSSGSGDSNDAEHEGAGLSATSIFEPAAKTLKSFLNEEDGGVGAGGASVKPIADLFPNCTVLFADIAGFTAWSSLRDPAQVFTLLENIYHSFDQIARKRQVFKVETVGDSYVAVTGLPDPQVDHALVMAKFARDCRTKMNEVTRKLELTLGPDTGDLSMRFGMHSGPVTAGVLRGERSRFQLFGDTVNTAARMESTGVREKIQCSQSTADILIAEGKGHWLRARENKVHAKGKGELQTYFIEIKSPPKDERRNSDHSQLSGDTLNEKSVIWGSEEEIPEAVTQRAKHQRLIDYNVDLLASHLRRVVARRNALLMAGRRCSQGGLPAVLHEPSTEVEDHMVLDEVTEVIRLPQYDATAIKGYIDPDTIELPSKVHSQLKRYVSVIAAMYRQNPFHNFEHASHVVMSMNKLLQRVTTPSIDLTKSENAASDLHNYTYGITSDAITQFAVVFSALIHDVDHWGVSNQQLVKEGAAIAKKYKEKSIAEQNSVDLAWDLLMDTDEYSDLQKCIFSNDAEYKRFRQVVVNLVMATDIFDKEHGELRKNRWAKAFSTEKKEDDEIDPDDEHRKATIVIEHIMQASDVAHTMQHWHVYQKWNRRLFDELYTAWRAGRSGADPSTFWYNGEMKFFDGYIIPLAKKLKDCGVFGVASDECLNYAVDNRKEWEAKGQMIVSELIANYAERDREEALRAQRAAEGNGGGGGEGGRKKRNRFSRRRSLITTGG